MSKQEPKLKRCPFCGGEPKRLEGESEAYCHGQNCPIRLHEMAYTRWNTRPLEDKLVGALEKIANGNTVISNGVRVHTVDFAGLTRIARTAIKEASHE